MAPIFRRLAARHDIDPHVAYCSLRGAQSARGPEFGATFRWDIPPLDGYSWTQVRNLGSGGEGFLGLCNPGPWKIVREGNFDATLCLQTIAARRSGSLG